MANDKLITVWTSHVKGMAFDLEDIGGMVMDEDIIVILTMGLGKGHDHFVTLIDVMLTQQLMVDYVVTRMLNEEVQSEEKGSTVQVLIMHRVIMHSHRWEPTSFAGNYALNLISHNA